MKDIEIISNITTIRVKMFTHNDLDGVSCALALRKFYRSKYFTFNIEFIGYDEYDKIKDFINIDNEEGIKKFDYVFITDLNFNNQNFYDKIYKPLREFTIELNNPAEGRSSLFKKIFFIDHHTDSETTFRDRVEELFPKIEYYNDLSYCASLQLFNFFKNNQSREWTQATIGTEDDKIEDVKSWLNSYLRYVHDWDTFDWKDNNDIIARDLNLVFSHINRSKFFLMQLQKDGLAFYFNKTEKTILKEVMDQINKDYQKALMTSVVLDHIDEDGFPHPDCQYIVIRSDDNTSLICDMIREAINRKEIYIRYNIKYIVNVSFKYGSINFRRVLEDIDCARIARMYGGGGHEYAAGCVLDGKNRLQLERILMPTLEKYGEPIRK